MTLKIAVALTAVAGIYLLLVTSDPLSYVVGALCIAVSAFGVVVLSGDGLIDEEADHRSL